ncbi:MAG: pfkB [Solirubrobacterales bacterium]|nr:pfkB [Solirubrobacterales bacterium]
MTTGAVLTVTANPAIDQTVWIPSFRAGEVNRVVREETSAGGKGVNVAAFLADFGLPVVATGILGTRNAERFDAFFAATGIQDDFVRIDATTRTGVKIVDDAAGETTDINFPGFTVANGTLDAVAARLEARVTVGQWVALAGSLPAGAPEDSYRHLTGVVRGRGGHVALDTSGPALAAALSAGPDLVKPNRAELEELTGRALPRREDLLDAARTLVGSGVPFVIVSDGAAGALFVRGDEAVYATPPPVQVASTVGAGDAMVAGTIAGLVGGLPLAEIAALATAFSAVAIARVGPRLDAHAARATAARVKVEHQ